MKLAESLTQLETFIRRVERYEMRTRAREQALKADGLPQKQIEYELCKIMPITIRGVWLYGSVLKGKRDPADIDLVVTRTPETRVQEDFRWVLDERGMHPVNITMQRLIKGIPKVKPRVFKELENAAGSLEDTLGTTFYLMWRRGEPRAIWLERIRILRHLPAIEKLQVLAFDNGNLRRRLREAAPKAYAGEQLAFTHGLKTEFRKFVRESREFADR